MQRKVQIWHRSRTILRLCRIISADYDTTVHFISEEELKRDHSGIPHGGFVIRSGKTGWNNENNHVIEYSLKLDSNPEFTSSVLVAYARAAYRMNKEGQSRRQDSI